MYITVAVITGTSQSPHKLYSRLTENNSVFSKRLQRIYEKLCTVNDLAGMAELADAEDLNPSELTHAGSMPAIRTKLG